MKTLTCNGNLVWAISPAYNPDFNDSEWRVINVPHDWSIENGYMEPLPVQQQSDTEASLSANQNNLPTGISAVRVNAFRKTAASTGFVEGGVAWYR